MLHGVTRLFDRNNVLCHYLIVAITPRKRMSYKMSKSPKATSKPVIVDDTASIGGNSVNALSMVQLAINEDCAASLIVDRIKLIGKARDDKALDAARLDYYVGKLMNGAGFSTETMARAELKKGEFLSLPKANNDTRMSHKATLVYRAARRMWSYYLDKAFGAKPKAATAPRTPEAKPVVAPASVAPVSVKALIVERAAKPEYVAHHFALLISHLRQYQKMNAAQFKGELGMELREWLVNAPSVE